MLKSLNTYINLRIKQKIESKFNKFDSNLAFAVIRDNGKVIHQFNDYNDASVFSIKLNTSYEKNGIKAFSKVIKLST